MGTALPPIPNATEDPIWRCMVDQIEIPATSPPLNEDPTNHSSLCAGVDLEDKEHVLTVNVASLGRAFKLDYILYIPSADVPLDTETIQVDSTDPALRYDGGWKDLKSIANATSTPGSKLTFDFIGESPSQSSFRCPSKPGTPLTIP